MKMTNKVKIAIIWILSDLHPIVTLGSDSKSDG
jgi:hypothetical protein